VVTPSRGTHPTLHGGAGIGSDLTSPSWEPAGSRDGLPSARTRPVASPRTARGLQGLGLSLREAKVYLALLSSGPSGARRATEGSGLHRATAYRVLSRLVARGLVSADRRWPREYHPLPLRVLVERNVAFLRDEIELRHWLLRAFPTAPEPGFGERLEPRSDRYHSTYSGDPDRPPLTPLGLTAIGSGADSPLLQQLQGARRALDGLIRPLMIPASLRSKVAISLQRAAARGTHVRIVLDYLAADLRFAGMLLRDRSGRVANLEVRHFTPLGGHLYVLDGQTAVRFPTLTGACREPDFGFLSGDPDFVRAQVARFEAVWDDAVARRAARLPPEFDPPVPTPLTEGIPRASRPGVGVVRPMPVGGLVGRVGSR